MGKPSAGTMPVIHRIKERSVRKLGGAASTRVVVVLAAVMALDSADKGSIGAMGPQLEAGLRIGQAELGLLVTVSSFAGAVGALLFGWLVDRMSRTRLLAAAVLVWSAIMVACAAATSYTFLLIVRIGLGVVVAAAVPAIASLTGDFFPTHIRAKMYGYILVGEFIGTGFGFLAAGELALLSWRVGFAFLAVMAVLVAWAVHRLPEPARGGAGRLRPGQKYVGQPPGDADREVRDSDQAQTRVIRTMIREANISPRPSLVLDENPNRKSLLWAAWYILRIPTNLVLIVASALGYYFFASARTFGVEFMQGWFRLPHSAAIGLVVLFGTTALVGVLLGGRLADALLARRHLTARVAVGVVAYFAAAGFLLASLLTRNLLVAGPILMAAGLSFGAINPPVDAARLDIMHPYLWGRAEAVRAVLRLGAEAVAPAVFGYIAGSVFGGGPAGLQRAFLLMVIPLLISGAIGIIAFHTYPRDVATAEAYAQRTQEHQDADRQ